MKNLARRQVGVTLLEAVITLAVMAIGLVGLMKIGNAFHDDAKNALYADSARQYGAASRNYIRDNYATIAASATSTNAYVITAPMLVAGGYLPTGATSKVGFRQDICTLVMQPSAGKLNGLVVSEQGDDLDDVTLSNIVGIGGASMGSVLSSAATLVTGAKGGWSFPVSDFDASVNQLAQRCDGVTAGPVRVAKGHIAIALWYEGNAAETSTLYRDAVPGQPQLNRMNTPIVFNAAQTVGSACSSAGALSNDSTGKMVNCSGGFWKQIASMYWADPVANFATLPMCDATVSGVTRVVRVPTVGTGPRPFACDGTSWKALTVDDAGNLTVPGVLSAGKVTLLDTVVAGAACAPNGQIARDVAGLILSCQSGVWNSVTKLPTCSGYPIGTSINYRWTGAYYLFEVCRGDGSWQSYVDNTQ